MVTVFLPSFLETETTSFINSSEGTFLGNSITTKFIWNMGWVDWGNRTRDMGHGEQPSLVTRPRHLAT